MGRNVFRHENWRGIVSAVDPGWHEAPRGGTGALPAFALANGHPAYRGALENGGDHWGAAADGWKWRRVLGGADRAIGDSGATGSYGNTVDGDRGLATAERAQAIGAGSIRNCVGFRGNGRTGWTGEIGIIRTRRPCRRGSAHRGVACLGLRFALFEAWGAAKFADVRSGHAGTVRRRSAMDCGALRRGNWAISSCGGADAGVDGGWVSVCIRFVHWIYGVSIYFEEKHGSEGGNVRVRESGRGADHWMAAGRGGIDAKNPVVRGGDFNGGSAGDYGSASRGRGGGYVAGSRGSVTKTSREFYLFERRFRIARLPALR